MNVKDYISKGFRNAGIGVVGAVINWILLFSITQYLGLWYIYSEVIATFFAWMFNYNMNILLKVIRIEPHKPSLSMAKPSLEESPELIRQSPEPKSDSVD